jgi:O-acetyl-ADP-ribose deacetylase (regulator of RNase III)
MSISVHYGDLFEADVDALVNAVNCRGVMGGGIAKEFRERFPFYYHDYKAKCGATMPYDIRLGFVDFYAQGFPKFLISFPTMYDPGSKSDIKDIERGLWHLVGCCEHYGVKSIALPALGCGVGGLDITDVSACMDAVFHSARYRVNAQLWLLPDGRTLLPPINDQGA